MTDLESCHDAFAQAALGGLPRGGRVAIVGVGKNVGKTTTLNTLLAGCHRRGVPCGVISIGRDGESTDILSGLPKPPVRVGTGDVFATTPKCLTALGCAAAEVRRFGWGGRPDTVLAVARRDVDVELISPGSLDRVQVLAGEVARLTGGWVFIDGAFGRRSPASIRVADRVILAVGATVGESLDEVVHATQAYAGVYDCGPPLGRVGAVFQAHTGRTVVLASDTGEVVESLDQLPSPAGDSRWFAFVPGAVTDVTLASFRRTRHQLRLVVAEVGHLLVSAAAWANWRQGGEVYVLHPIPLVAVTANPVQPGGKSFDSRAFTAAVAGTTRAPVFDLHAGTRSSQTGR